MCPLFFFNYVSSQNLSGPVERTLIRLMSSYNYFATRHINVAITSWAAASACSRSCNQGAN